MYSHNADAQRKGIILKVKLLYNQGSKMLIISILYFEIFQLYLKKLWDNSCFALGTLIPPLYFCMKIREGEVPISSNCGVSNHVGTLRGALTLRGPILTPILDPAGQI